MLKRIIVVVYLLFVVNVVIAGQFGLKMGMTVNQLKNMGCNPIQIKQDYYVINVPKPLSIFNTYTVRISPNHGLYFILAITDTIESSPNGFELKQIYYDLKNRLISKYGNCRYVESIQNGSILTEPSEWMLAMNCHQAMYLSAWGDTTTNKLPKNLKEIGLGINVDDILHGEVAVSYCFKNQDMCEKELKAIEDNAL